MTDSAETPLESSPALAGERVTFTGTLASMTHSQAGTLVVEHGGEATSHVSRQTTLLVIGEEGWPLEEDGQPSVKLIQAREQMEAGQPLRLLRESDFLKLLGLEETDNRQELHTPAMLQQSLGIRVGVVRRWARLGIINPVRRVFRLPYFDVQEVTGVRRLQELLEAGVTRSRIEESLADLQHILPSFDRPILQLELLARDSRVVFRDEAGLLDPSSGQRVFDFEPPSGTSASTVAPSSSGEANTRRTEEGAPQQSSASPSPLTDEHAIQQSWTAEDWFEHGGRLLEEDRPEEAVEAFRLSLMDAPGDPETQFHLADALVRSGSLAAALERYHMAVELDHDYIEAWTQLGCVRSQLGDRQGALDAFDIALAAHPEYPDALYFKATALAEEDRHDEAAELWRAYLRRNSRGPWAEVAREQLGES
jgi:tetratricopeptide (TPR) repeat protein